MRNPAEKGVLLTSYPQGFLVGIISVGFLLALNLSHLV